jgi:hypothetical protein
MTQTVIAILILAVAVFYVIRKTMSALAPKKKPCGCGGCGCGGKKKEPAAQ